MRGRDQHLVDCALDVMLTSAPLLKALHGEKRAAFHRAFTGFAIAYGSHVMNEEEGRLPRTDLEAARALHRAVLDLCSRAGLSRRDLTEDYNDHGESGAFANGGVGEAAERTLALLSIFHARRLTHAEAAE
jgi:hypothetical protein